MSGWQSFVDEYGIEYRQGSGSNIEVQCPLCGSDDRSMHLGLHLESSSYGCWKEAEHRGKNPERIIKALIGCTWEEAKRLNQQYFRWEHAPYVPPLEGESVPVSVPEEFCKFGQDSRMEEQFKRYIASRGIDPGYAIPRYDLRWCAFGYYAYRLVIPVIHQGVWWTWQARTINDHEVRFLAAQTKDSDKRKADTANKPNDFLFDGDNLKGGRLLVLCEGAWDAIKINSAMIPGVSATALYGKVLMPKQMTKLIEVSQGYDKVAIGLDKDAYVDSLKLRDRLQWYVPSVTIATPNDKDWGVMKQSDIKKDLVAVC